MKIITQKLKMSHQSDNDAYQLPHINGQANESVYVSVEICISKFDLRSCENYPDYQQEYR